MNHELSTTTKQQTDNNKLLFSLELLLSIFVIVLLVHSSWMIVHGFGPVKQIKYRVKT